MADTNDDITVTTATQTAEEVKASLEAPAAAPPAAAAPPVPAASAAATTPEAEADSARPDPEVSEAARTLRKSRLSDKVTRLKSDTALYESHIRELGGSVAPLDRREYPNAQAEIDHLTRRRHELVEQSTRLLSQRRQRPEPPKPAPAAPPAAAAPPAGPAEPKFAFETWEEYQAKHPEAEYADYNDARTDARYAWNEGVSQAKAQHAAETQRQTEAQRQQTEAFTTFGQHEAAFKAAHPDYDAKLEAIDLVALGAGRLAVDGQIIPGPAWLALQRQMFRAGPDAPAMLYHLATHPADAARLLQARTPADLLETFGELRYTVRTAQAAAPPAAAAPAAAPAAAAPPADPPKPVSATPAPLSPVGGGAQHTRTLQQVADASEDADEYVEMRKRQLQPTG